MTYLNWRGPQGRETVDEINPKDFADSRAFRAEARRLAGEYTLAGMSVYQSARPCNGWQS